MDIDIIRIYKKLKDKYPIELTGTDYPILSGTSALGNFEMFFDDIPSFAFYAMRENREVFAHTHFYTTSEAEQTVVAFMEETCEFDWQEIKKV